MVCTGIQAWAYTQGHVCEAMVCALMSMRARWRRGRGMRCPVRARYAYGEGVEGATGGVRPSEGHNPYMRHSRRFANRRCNTECCFVAQVVRAYQNGEAGTVGHACEVGEAGVALAASLRDFCARVRVSCVHQIGLTRLRRTRVLAPRVRWLRIDAR